MKHPVYPCNQTDCPEPGAYRFTWPGRDEAFVCEKHAPQLRAVASAIGMHLQLIPLAPLVSPEPPLVCPACDSTSVITASDATGFGAWQCQHCDVSGSYPQLRLHDHP